MKGIITADWHLRGERPSCRLDENWLEAQRNNIQFIVDYANENKLAIFNLGDLFHTPRCSTEVVNMSIKELGNAKFGMRVLVGNHDIPYHDYGQLSKSSIGTLLHVFEELKNNEEGGWCAYPFGCDEQSDAPIRFIHKLVFFDEKQRPIKDCGTTAEELLDMYPEQQWIFTGDMHHAFHFEKDGRHVVNPGCLSIQASDMSDYKPRFAVVDTSIGSVDWILIPQPENVIEVSYNQEKVKRNERMSAFVEKIASTKKGVSLSFWGNLETAMSKCSNGVQKRILQIKEQVLNEGK